MVFTEVIEFIFDYPELGWMLVMMYLAYELRGKRGRIYNLDKKLTSAIIVVRALARTYDDMDEQAVDEYLVENGMEPGDFIEGEQREEEVKRQGDGGILRSDGKGRFSVDDVLSDGDGDEEDGESQEFTT